MYKPETSVIDFDREWSMIEAQLPENWRELADEAGLVPAHPPPGAKVLNVQDVESVLRLIFYHVATNTSLRTTTAMGVAANLIKLSAVALHLWMKKSGAFLGTVLELVTTTRETFAAKRWAGYDIRVVDASTVQRPGAIGTTSRIHYELQLTSLRPTQIIITTEKVGETFRHFEAKRGQLFVGDRAYSNPPGIASIDEQGAHMLVRYNRSSLPVYNARGNRLSVFTFFKKLRTRNLVRDWVVYVQPDDTNPIKGRLCMVRLPKDKAEEARQRLRNEYRRKGKNLSNDALKAAEYVVVFTTIPQTRLNKKEVMDLYGLRWQVELAFKREKSITGLDELPNFREDTIETWICTKLLLSQIAQKIASADENVDSANSLGPKPPTTLPFVLLNFDHEINLGLPLPRESHRTLVATA